MPTVELYGVLRLKAGTGAITVAAGTVGAALVEAERQVANLKGVLVTDDRLSPAYRLSINGLHFISDLARPLAPNDALLVIAADPGG